MEADCDEERGEIDDDLQSIAFPQIVQEARPSPVVDADFKAMNTLRRTMAWNPINPTQSFLYWLANRNRSLFPPVIVNWSPV